MRDSDLGTLDLVEFGIDDLFHHCRSFDQSLLILALNHNCTSLYVYIDSDAFKFSLQLLQVRALGSK